MKGSTPGERLKAARENAKFRSARSAAVENEWPYATYYAHESDTRGLDETHARKYARRFGVNWLWLMHNVGDNDAADTIIVSGLIGAGGRIGTEGENHEGLEEITVPFALPETALAFRIVGESMFPRYDDGDVVIILDRPHDARELMHFEAVVTTIDGDRYLKRIVEGSKADAFDLESFNAPTMKNIRIARAAPVHTVIRKGRWQPFKSKGKGRIR